MSATRKSVEMEESVSTHSGHTTVTVQKGTRASFVMIRHLVIREMTRRYSMKLNLCRSKSFKMSSSRIQKVLAFWACFLGIQLVPNGSWHSQWSCWDLWVCSGLPGRFICRIGMFVYVLDEWKCDNGSFHLKLSRSWPLSCTIYLVFRLQAQLTLHIVRRKVLSVFPIRL